MEDGGKGGKGVEERWLGEWTGERISQKTRYSSGMRQRKERFGWGKIGSVGDLDAKIEVWVRKREVWVNEREVWEWGKQASVGENVGLDGKI